MIIVVMKEERTDRLLPLQGWTMTMGLSSLYSKVIHSFWSFLCPVECIHLAIQICLVPEYKYPSMMLIFRLIHPRVIQLIYSSIQFITQKPIYLLTNQSINQTQGKQSCPSIQATTSVATQ